MVNPLAENARDLERELDWFSQVLEARLQLYFQREGAPPSVFAFGPPPLDKSESPYARFVTERRLSFAERIVLLLALIPLVRPQVLDVLWCKNQATERGFTEFGGVVGGNHGGFIPTGETAAFILAGADLATRFDVTRIFDGGHFFAQHDVLQLSPVAPGESLLSGALSLSREYRRLFTTGDASKPAFSTEFPARRIETGLTWEQLVLPAATHEQLDEIRNWIQHGQRLLRDWEMGGKIQPGFTSLFHGPPGTGKTLSACLLGRHCGCDVYKIDLSMIASKYIGETEKNLSRVFDLAEHKNWILFFDEADALFGKRTQVENAHDRFANQEVSYLLQRIEEFHGVVILASNLMANIDEAFVRRFQSVVSFAMPRPSERLRLWRDAFSTHCRLEPRIDLEAIAQKYDLAGGTIMNVVRFASLKALSRDDNVIRLEDIETGVRREYLKEGRTA